MVGSHSPIHHWVIDRIAASIMINESSTSSYGAKLISIYAWKTDLPSDPT